MSTIRAGNTNTTALTTVSDLTGQLNLEAASGVINTGSNTGGFIIPSGTTAQRPASASAGMIRYNTTTGSLEGYSNTWAVLAGGPPEFIGVTPTAYNGETGTVFTISGMNFTGDATVKFVDVNNVEYAATSTFISGTQLTVTSPQDFTVAQEPLKLKISQTSGSVTSLGVIDCGNTPAWVTAAGTLATVFDSTRSNFSSSVSALDVDSNSTITYSIVSGSLPTGVSLNSSTGALTGTPNSVGTDTTYTFTVQALDNAGNTSTREFNIVIKAPVLSVFNYTGGDQTYSVPAGVSLLTFKLWGAGGSGNNASGGAGGFTQSTINVTSGQSYTLIVGQASYDRNAAVNYGGGQRSNWDGGNSGGDGGGRSAVRLSGTEILTAGGGGGGGYSAGAGGGNGGGLTGVAATGGGGRGGGGGTQTGGGYAGPCGSSCGGAGSQFQGGGTGGGWTGGGGGGGWYGGGGGGGVDSQHDGGGGGSGWVGRNGSTTLTGDSYDGDASPRTDTVSGIVYRNTKCYRGNNSSDIHWANNAGSAGYKTGYSGRIVVYYQ